VTVERLREHAVIVYPVAVSVIVCGRHCVRSISLYTFIIEWAERWVKQHSLYVRHVTHVSWCNHSQVHAAATLSCLM